MSSPSSPAGLPERRRVRLVARDIRRERSPLSWALPWRARRAVGSIEIRCELFAVDSTRLYRLLDYYHADPRARWELGTPASLQRVQEGRYPRISADRRR